MIVPSDEMTTTMKAVQGKDYGDIDQMISVASGVPRPKLADLPPKKRKNHIVIKTHAVSLACGDCRVLSGLTRELQGPPSFPYVPGGDCSGIVVEIPEDAPKDLPFKVGDRVAARFVDGPRGALGEYSIVRHAVCDKVPDNVSSEEAAALVSASPATLLADRFHEGERILILGAGGGVGSHVCQMIRSRGASLIVGVSQSAERLLQPPLSYDKAVDYTKENVFLSEEFKNNPFDVILDLAGGGWLQLLDDFEKGAPSIVKPASQGGRYLTTTPDTAIFEAHSVWPALKLFMFIPLGRAIFSRTWGRSKMPKYTFAMSLSEERQVVTCTLEYASKGTLKAVLDPKGPFPFTTEGARAAFRVQESRHGHGKIVITVSNGEK
jgi:NADPH:quinone reductase-like Zn-dependent oxidoreductase